MLPAGGVGAVMCEIEHPEVAAIQRTGYPSWIECENKDTMAELKEYATEYALEIIKWLLDGYPGIIREFSEYDTRNGATNYQDWMNRGIWSWLYGNYNKTAHMGN